MVCSDIYDELKQHALWSKTDGEEGNHTRQCYGQTSNTPCRQ